MFRFFNIFASERIFPGSSADATIFFSCGWPNARARQGAMPSRHDFSFGSKKKRHALGGEVAAVYLSSFTFGNWGLQTSTGITVLFTQMVIDS